MAENYIEQTETLAKDRPQEDSSSIERCLTFESGGLVMYMSTDYVIEIINGHSITTLPMVPGYVKGIINLRGSILPVIDIRLLMGKEAADYTSKTCIIVVSIHSITLGIVVDKVRQVIDIDLSEVQPIPLRNRQKLTNGMLTLDSGEVAMSFDAAALVESPLE
ncbi:chemotaxis protein CheW [Oribacterium sp. oral taxon 102]|uniref:chemotaxis protein CheW n=1 Tax=Oribacterium sp. oral taxon 102 TaxID=671214 RepID=UPI0015B96E2F|nr:chemotaxis protein CheW [Oribacterium sp. oral taxon 102]NWO21910.1 chemotaxis protein CheW [Oribacterium sp. oral taxon 102]